MRGWRLLLAAPLLWLAGCASPFLHPAATPAQAVRDDGLVGHWVTSDPGQPTQASVVIRPPAQGQTYRAAITVLHEGEFKTGLGAELILTDVDGVRYADLFLDRAERDRLVERYGFLVVPVHQVCRVEREADALRIWWFEGSWLERSADEATSDRVTVGSGEVSLVTGGAEQVRALIASAGDDAFGAPMEFRRLSRPPGEERPQ